MFPFKESKRGPLWQGSDRNSTETQGSGRSTKAYVLQNGPGFLGKDYVYILVIFCLLDPGPTIGWRRVHCTLPSTAIYNIVVPKLMNGVQFMFSGYCIWGYTWIFMIFQHLPTVQHLCLFINKNQPSSADMLHTWKMPSHLFTPRLFQISGFGKSSATTWAPSCINSGKGPIAEPGRPVTRWPFGAWIVQLRTGKTCDLLKLESHALEGPSPRVAVMGATMTL